MLKKAKKKEKRSCHVGWGPGHSQPCQVSVKSVKGFWLLEGSELEMGRSSADTEVRPKNSAECSARFGSATCDYSAEVQPNFGKHSASFLASHLRRFALAAGVN